MKKTYTPIVILLLIFSSISVIGQGTYWVTTDAGNQMQVSTNSVQNLPLNTPGTSLTTIFGTDNSFAGNMFDVEVVGSSSIYINSFDLNIVVDANPTCTIRVYYRDDTYVGHDGSSAGWNLVSEISGVVPQGTDVPTHIVTDNILLSPGNTYGFYITVTDYPSATMLYTNGSNVYNDGFIEVRTGYGMASPDFGGNFDPRTWNGTIYYSTSIAVPVPYWAIGLVLLLIPATVVLRSRRKRLA